MNCRMLEALWAGELSWWSSHDLFGHKSHIFSLTKQSRRHEISLLIDNLALWLEFVVDDAPHIEEGDQHNFDIWLWISCILRSPRRQRLPLTALAVSFRVVLKISCFINSDGFTKQVWFSLKKFDDVLIHLHPMLLLVIIQQSWYHFPHAQIFSDNLPHTVHLTCDHSKSTDNRHTLPVLPVQRWSVLLVESLPLLESSSTFLHLSLNFLCH